MPGAEDEGVEPRGLVAAPGVQGQLRRRPRVFHAESGGHDPQRVRRSAFETVPAPRRDHSPGQRTERTMPSAFRRPYGFQPQPAAWLVHPPRKASDSNATGSPRIR